MQHNNQKFIDLEFLPINSSLYSDEYSKFDLEIFMINFFLKCKIKKWIRAEKIKSTHKDKYLPLTLISNPTPDDIEQGFLFSKNTT
jgi:hypothetical protein